MKPNIKYDELLNTVTDQFDVTPEQILKGRTKRIVEARHVLWHGLNQVGWSAGEIAERTGHSRYSVYAALKDPYAGAKARAFVAYLEMEHA